MDIGNTRRENGEGAKDAGLKLITMGPIADFGEYISRRQGRPRTTRVSVQPLLQRKINKHYIF
jgi:hypothetical protein